MRAKSMILIVIALGCGLIASIGISQVMERGSEAPVQPETVPVLVAAADIDIGESFTADNVKLEQWPLDRVPLQAIGSLDDLQGHYPRTRMYAGEVILAAKLMSGELGSPSITIPEGYRVTSVRVTMDSSVSGLVLPGDRVDIVAFLKRGGEVPRTITRTILRDVRVFAIDSQTEREVDTEGNTTGLAKTVSLLVKRDQVEPLMLALELGTLRLSLRRPNEVDERVAANEATVESILGRPAERADERPRTDSEPPLDLAAMIVSDPPTPAPEAAHEMLILSPQGASRYRWTDVQMPPQEVPWGAAANDPPAVTPPAGNPEAREDRADRADRAGSAGQVLDGQSPDLPNTDDYLGSLDARR